MKVRKLQEPRGWAWYVGPAIIKPLLLATTKQRWVDGEKLPAVGGFVVAMNHLSHVDPLTAAHLLYDHGRLPRYLAKAGLFSNKVLGYFLRAAGQIPVERATSNAAGAYVAAVQAVRDGNCVVVYPEGTITRDPDGWPMVGKSGAARIALETGCPVYPVGQWGAQELLPAYSKRPHLMPRTSIAMKVGDPVDLSDLVDQPRSMEVVNEATERIMAAITGLVEDIRGAEAPATRYDMRISGDPYRPGAPRSSAEPDGLGDPGGTEGSERRGGQS
ncbi:1-acyl-sn-glycerol-3-phosphate acyltransferase [Nocardioides sp. R-C-SC26]|uniref:lysophospholipid acyltransferase family protein n=1 Tax=Nocardioides sp. R-C-SC26 TaxID=2870414 RepID=UPI001E321C24|nr:lysophospholipid acyltransferase family protein [Nocardioides sp. R-C-SC26]